MAISYALFIRGMGGVHFVRELSKKGISPKIVVCDDMDHYHDYDISTISKDDSDLSLKLKNEQLDCIILTFWPYKVSPDIYNLMPLGGWNIHPSLLPKYRGADPLFWTIARGEKEAGITIHQLTDQFDEGPILFQKHLVIQESETEGYLLGRVQMMIGEIFPKILAKLESNNIDVVPQKPGKYPKAPRVKRADLILRSDMTVSQCQRLIRASNPFHGSLLSIGNKSVIVMEASTKRKGPLIPCRDGKLFATLIKVDPYGYITGERFLELFTKTKQY